MNEGDGYSSLFYFMLIVGIVGIVGIIGMVGFVVVAGSIP